MLAENVRDRGGLQPLVSATANGEICVYVQPGEEIAFAARVEVPAGTGLVTEIAWDFEGSGQFTPCPFDRKPDGQCAIAHCTHAFSQPGTYFPVVRGQSEREGNIDHLFTQCRNLARLRVVVEEKA